MIERNLAYLDYSEYLQTYGGYTEADLKKAEEIEDKES